MTVDWRTARSWLFVPADRPDRYDTAASSGADAVIIDLEDAVAPHARPTARRHAVTWLSGKQHAWVRINAASTDDWHYDLIALGERAQAGLDGIVLPKVQSADEIANTVSRLAMPVIALVETALGIRNAYEAARAPNVAALALGVVDLQLDVGLGTDPGAWAYARSSVVFASRAAGLRAPIDGPSMALDDQTATAVEAERAREFGFGGKLCVHPHQLAAVGSAFANCADEVAWARHVVAAAEHARGASFRIGSEMVDRPRLAHAQEILARPPSPNDSD